MTRPTQEEVAAMSQAEANLAIVTALNGVIETLNGGPENVHPRAVDGGDSG